MTTYATRAALLAACFGASAAYPNEPMQEEIIVSAHRTPQPASTVGSSVSVITAADIEAQRTTLAADLLRQIASVAVSQSGPRGGVAQVRLRGAEGNHTLVRLDGIELNDPSLGSEYNFADMSTVGIERIEILRGPQSALYGSDAIGGVISLVSATPEAGWQFGLQGELGRYDTSMAAAHAGYGGERFSASLLVQQHDSDGVSASAIQGEEDGYEQTTAHLKLDVQLSDHWNLRGVLRTSDNEADGDAQDFAFPSTPTQGLVIDSEDGTESEQTYALVAADFGLGDWRATLQHVVTDVDTDFITSGVVSAGGQGERKQTELSGAYSPNWGQLNHQLSLALQREALDFENRSASFPGANYTADDEQDSLIFEYALRDEHRWSLSASARHDRNDRFEDATTVRATASLALPIQGARVHTSYGQGVTNPTFTELFGFIPSSFVGNPDLEPEKSSGWDFGIGYNDPSGRWWTDLTWFKTDLEDEITTVFDFTTFTSTAINQSGSSDREGVELGAGAALGAFSATLQYTYLDATDPDGRQEVRRPRHSGSLLLGYALTERLDATLSYVSNGDMADSEFIFATPEDRVTLSSYDLLGLTVNYRPSERVALYVRGENLTDESYNEVFGYRALGRRLTAGFKLSL